MSAKLAEWTYTDTMFAFSEAEARSLAASKAARDVPDATVEIVSVRRTPTGRYSVKIRRVRP